MCTPSGEEDLVADINELEAFSEPEEGETITRNSSYDVSYTVFLSFFFWSIMFAEFE